MVAAACSLTSGAALLGVYYNSDLLTLLTCTAVVAIFIATGMFGRAELFLLGNRLGHVGKSLIPSFTSKKNGVRETTIRLQGSGDWNVLWETLIESASKFGLHEIHLNVSSPIIQEDYHASWVRPDGEGNRDRRWQMELPLLVADRSIGFLKIVGNRLEESSCGNMQGLLEFVGLLEKELSALCEEVVPTPMLTTAKDYGPVAVGGDVASVTRQHPK